MVRFTKEKVIIEIDAGQYPVAELQEFRNALLEALALLDGRQHSEAKDFCVQRLAYLLAAMEFDEDQLNAIDKLLFDRDEYERFVNCFLVQAN